MHYFQIFVDFFLFLLLAIIVVSSSCLE